MLNGFQNHFFILLNFIAKHVILGSSKNGTERERLALSFGVWWVEEKRNVYGENYLSWWCSGIARLEVYKIVKTLLTIIKRKASLNVP